MTDLVDTDDFDLDLEVNDEENPPTANGVNLVDKNKKANLTIVWIVLGVLVVCGLLAGGVYALRNQISAGYSQVVELITGEPAAEIVVGDPYDPATLPQVMYAPGDTAVELNISGFCPGETTMVINPANYTEGVQTIYSPKGCAFDILFVAP